VKRGGAWKKAGFPLIHQKKGSNRGLRPRGGDGKKREGTPMVSYSAVTSLEGAKDGAGPSGLATVVFNCSKARQGKEERKSRDPESE